MFGLKKKQPAPTPPGVIMHEGPLSNLPPIDPAYRKPPTASYIEIFISKKERCHLRIRGGNNKIRFHSENYYSKRNARRAAKLFSQETGLPVVDRIDSHV